MLFWLTARSFQCYWCGYGLVQKVCWMVNFKVNYVKGIVISVAVYMSNAIRFDLLVMIGIGVFILVFLIAMVWILPFCFKRSNAADAVMPSTLHPRLLLWIPPKQFSLSSTFSLRDSLSYWIKCILSQVKICTRVICLHLGKLPSRSTDERAVDLGVKNSSNLFFDFFLVCNKLSLKLLQHKN